MTPYGYSLVKEYRRAKRQFDKYRDALSKEVLEESLRRLHCLKQGVHIAYMNGHLSYEERYKLYKD